jgi:tRNA-Thr(GGU) m(6)t(6)A37 methyltransferase TsaA
LTRYDDDEDVDDVQRFELRVIGLVRSPLRDPADAPRQGDEGAPPAYLMLDPEVWPGLAGLRVGEEVLVLTWLHLARRDVLLTRPRNDPDREKQGVFTTRSPDRPNPLGLHRVRVLALRDNAVEVSGLEAVDGTPVVDLKPLLGPIDER